MKINLPKNFFDFNKNSDLTSEDIKVVKEFLANYEKSLAKDSDNYFFFFLGKIAGRIEQNEKLKQEKNDYIRALAKLEIANNYLKSLANYSDMVLKFVCEAKEVTQDELVKATCLKPKSLNQIVTRLFIEGILTCRKSGDSGEFIYSLTSIGKRILELEDFYNFSF